MDIAASIQKVTEEIMLNLARSLKEEYKITICVSRWCSFELCCKWKNS